MNRMLIKRCLRSGMQLLRQDTDLTTCSSIMYQRTLRTVLTNDVFHSRYGIIIQCSLSPTSMVMSAPASHKALTASRELTEHHEIIEVTIETGRQRFISRSNKEVEGHKKLGMSGGFMGTTTNQRTALGHVIPIGQSEASTEAECVICAVKTSGGLGQID